MFYDRYINLCSEKRISPSKAAIECGFNKGSVSVWKKRFENGEDIQPTPEILIKIADYFGVTVDYLLGNDENKNSPLSNENGLSESQREIIALFDSAPPELQAAALAVLRSAEQRSHTQDAE